ncbi:MAG: hypothetical protein V9E90_09350 [Saprospiraceae bacterium]
MAISICFTSTYDLFHTYFKSVRFLTSFGSVIQETGKMTRIFFSFFQNQVVRKFSFFKMNDRKRLLFIQKKIGLAGMPIFTQEFNVWLDAFFIEQEVNECSGHLKTGRKDHTSNFLISEFIFYLRTYLRILVDRILSFCDLCIIRKDWFDGSYIDKNGMGQTDIGWYESNESRISSKPKVI